MMWFGDSKYDDLELRYLKLQLDHNTLIDRWNALVKKINLLGGDDFLSRKSNQFTPNEIKTMIKLCHPDKHKGNDKATEITKKLLLMRGK